MKTRSRWLASFGVAGMLVMAGCVDPLGMDDAGNTQTLRVATWPPRAELLGARIDGDWVVAGSERIGWVADGSGLRGATAPRRASDGPRAAPSIDSGVICWYLITFVTTTGEIVSVKFLGCTSGGGGTQCDEEQRRIADEYRNAGWVFGRKAPACDDIEKNGSGTAHFSWAELNGWFQEGNPHTGYGWVQQSLKTGIEDLRAKWGRSALRIARGYSAGLVLTSGYRCPHGNASVPDASISSYHMEGRAVDISTRTILGLAGVPYARMTPAQQAELKAVYLELLSLGGNHDEQPWDQYKEDRHFHFAK